jgi:hypothetical protein
MFRDTLASSNENGPRVQHLIGKTFDQHRGCLRALIDVSSSLGEALRGAKPTPAVPLSAEPGG